VRCCFTPCSSPCAKKRHSQPDGRIPAFLVLDNPLGVCNRSDFLDAQLKVARAMGIQCVYLTGINDRESLDLFELRVAIRKGNKKVEIDHTAYEPAGDHRTQRGERPMNQSLA
jgi:hypothetical protein